MKNKRAQSQLSIFRSNSRVLNSYTWLIALTASAFYASSILAFIGLGLTFWGALLLYITPTKYVKLELLNAVAHVKGREFKRPKCGLTYNRDLNACINIAHALKRGMG